MMTALSLPPADFGGAESAVQRRAQRGVDTVDKNNMRLPGLATLGRAGGVRWCYGL